MIVLSLGLLLRVLAWLTLPLVVTNDGVFYLEWGQQLASGLWPDLPATRTPGYVVWLAGVVALLGPTAGGVAASQHALTLLAAAFAWVIARACVRGWLAGSAQNAAALAAGLCVAFDPWLLAMGSYALSEALSVTLALGALAAVAGRAGLPRSLAAGAVIGCAVLVRPSMLAWLPGIALVALCAPAARPRCRVARAGAVLLGAVLVVSPWVAHNASRGVTGIARTDGLALWGGLARAGLLEPDYPVPLHLQPRAAAILGGDRNEPAIMGFYSAAGRLDALDRAALLGGWARASIAEDPAGYAKAAAHAAAWQSNAMLPGTPYRNDELRWYLRRLGGHDAPASGPTNLAVNNGRPVPEGYHDGPARGPLAWVYRRWPVGMFQCLPQAPLGALTLVTIAWLLARRRWQAAAVLAASLPIVLGHALLLQPFARYSLSAWMVWWVGGVVLLTLVLPRAGALVRHPVPERIGDDR